MRIFKIFSVTRSRNVGSDLMNSVNKNLSIVDTREQSLELLEKQLTQLGREDVTLSVAELRQIVTGIKSKK